MYFFGLGWWWCVYIWLDAKHDSQFIVGFLKILVLFSLALVGNFVVFCLPFLSFEGRTIIFMDWKNSFFLHGDWRSLGDYSFKFACFSSILEFSYLFVLAARTLQNGLSVDPCTPNGYSHISESEALSPGYMVERNRYLSTFHSKGNFSECRSVALMLLQKGKGCTNLHMLDSLKPAW